MYNSYLTLFSFDVFHRVIWGTPYNHLFSLLIHEVFVSMSDVVEHL